MARAEPDLQVVQAPDGVRRHFQEHSSQGRRSPPVRTGGAPGRCKDDTAFNRELTAGLPQACQCFAWGPCSMRSAHSSSSRAIFRSRSTEEGTKAAIASSRHFLARARSVATALSMRHLPVPKNARRGRQSHRPLNGQAADGKPLLIARGSRAIRTGSDLFRVQNRELPRWIDSLYSNRLDRERRSDACSASPAWNSNKPS